MSKVYQIDEIKDNQTILMQTGMKCLIDTLGEVDAERFIAQIIREPFDYTKWQKNLFTGMWWRQSAPLLPSIAEKTPVANA